jgi:cytochrome c oxidase subunit 3
MAIAEKAHSMAEHHADDHEHGEFIAHHFDTAEQQFDSGKLGIWLFLVTEILFFSGLFVLYTLYRSHHPEIYEQAHVFLDKYLGGLNTLVLLFSSLTMALGVRCAQMGNNRGTAVYTLITMFCAAMFIGVKAIEYSHKWDMGIWVRSAFSLHEGHHEAPEGTIAHSLGVSQYLVYFSAIPAILLVVFAGLSAFGFMIQRTVISKFFAGLAFTTLGYFFGVLVGHFYMQITGGGTGGSHAARPVLLHALGDEHGSQTVEVDSGHHSETKVGDQQAGQGTAGHVDGSAAGNDHGPDKSDLNRDIGIFFSIYYCMTGLHAVHILAGIAFLSWIFSRSLQGHWRSDYFGPVDYVGLYWHLVDMIWIYLFPLLYLID